VNFWKPKGGGNRIAWEKKPPAGPERASDWRFDARPERLLSVALLQVRCARFCQERRQRPQPYAMPKVKVKSRAGEFFRDMLARIRERRKFIGRCGRKSPRPRGDKSEDCGAVRRKVFSRLPSFPVRSRSLSDSQLPPPDWHCGVRSGCVARRAATDYITAGPCMRAENRDHRRGDQAVRRTAEEASLTSTKRAPAGQLNRQAEDPTLWNDRARQPGDAGAHRARRAADRARSHRPRTSTTRSP